MVLFVVGVPDGRGRVHLERRVRTGMVLFVVGVPGGSGMGTPGTEGVNWEGSVQDRRARWKGRRGFCD